jgi:hypothetical protein
LNTSHDERRRHRTPDAQKTPGYSWPTPKYRNWCAQHAFFEGKKAEETAPRKSTLRTLKGVGQQYPGDNRALRKKHGNGNLRHERTLPAVACPYSHTK